MVPTSSSVKRFNDAYWALRDENLSPQDILDVASQVKNGLIYRILEPLTDKLGSLGRLGLRLSAYPSTDSTEQETAVSVNLFSEWDGLIGAGYARTKGATFFRDSFAVFSEALREQGLGSLIDETLIDYALLSRFPPENILTSRVRDTSPAKNFEKGLLQRVQRRVEALTPYMLGR